jgi:peptidoglycan/xylan/chitin deacetylase (PgdA/CDA1 family)
LVIVVALVPAVTTAGATGSAALGTQQVPILMYHVIGPPPADAAYPGLWIDAAAFREQIETLSRKGYRGVTLAAVWEHWRTARALPPKPVVVTFDDGYESVAARALPVLDRVGWPAVLNLTVDHIGSSIRASSVRALTAAGWELGAHSRTHADLTGVPDERLAREVTGSRRMLERRFGVRVRFFSYPAGSYDARVIAAVRRTGYAGATTTEPGVGRRTEPFTLRRVRVERGDTGTDVAAAIAAARR